MTKFIDGNNNDIAASSSTVRSVLAARRGRTTTASPSSVTRMRPIACCGVSEAARRPADAVPANDGGGFYFDNVQSSSYEDRRTTRAPNPPAGPAGPQGEQGPAGQNGTNGVDGGQPARTVPPRSSQGCVAQLTGNSVRTLHARKIKGMKFLSARATMGGKRLSSTVARSRLTFAARRWATIASTRAPGTRPTARPSRSTVPLPARSYRPVVRNPHGFTEARPCGGLSCVRGSVLRSQVAANAASRTTAVDAALCDRPHAANDCGRGTARRHGAPAAGGGRCLERRPILSSRG